MDILDYLLWFIAIFAVVYGALLLILPRNTLTPTIKKQLQSKGNNSPTSEDIDKKLRFFRLMGLVCLLAGAVLFYINLTGGIFAF